MLLLGSRTLGPLICESVLNGTFGPGKACITLNFWNQGTLQVNWAKYSHVTRLCRCACATRNDPLSCECSSGCDTWTQPGGCFVTSGLWNSHLRQHVSSWLDLAEKVLPSCAKCAILIVAAGGFGETNDPSTYVGPLSGSLARPAFISSAAVRLQAIRSISKMSIRA